MADGITEDVEPEFDQTDEDAENVITLPADGEEIRLKSEEDEEKEEAEAAAVAAAQEELEQKEGEEAPNGEIEETKHQEEDKKEVVEKPDDEVGEDETEAKSGQKKEEEPTVEQVKSLSVVSAEDDLSSEFIVTIDREEYIVRYKELMEERTELNFRNLIYNRKAVDYFRRKKVQMTPREDIKNIEEMEKKYAKILTDFEDCNITFENEQNLIEAQRKQLQEHYDEKQSNFEKLLKNYQQIEREVAKTLLYSTNGKKMSNEVVNLHLTRQRKKLDDLITMRLNYIVTRNKLAKSEKKLEDVDRLDEGFLVEDFEKLKAANETYMKRLEERDHTLLKERAVCSTYIEMLAHMKEQKQFEFGKCDEAKYNLESVQTEYDGARRDQTKAKFKLRKLKHALHNQHQAMGLAVHPKLLKNFKDTRRKISKLQTDIEVLLDELDRSKLEKAFRNPQSMFATHCTPMKSRRVRPKFHQSAYLRS